MSVASAWASGPVRSSFRAGIPSVRTASGKASILKLRQGLMIPLTPTISGWKSKYATIGPPDSREKERQGRRCPLCRGTIPPSREEIAKIKMFKSLKNTAHPNYDVLAEQVKQFEAKYGKDWEDNMIEYSSSDFVNLPKYLVKAAGEGNLRVVLQWLGKGNIKDRVNAKCEEGGSASLLLSAALGRHHNLMTYLLLNGADVNIIGADGSSVLVMTCCETNTSGDHSNFARLLLSWGAELFLQGKQMTKEHKLELCDGISESNVKFANLVSSELGGRRCEIVSAPSTRDDLVGKTCVVEEYIKTSDQYKVKMEFTSEVLLLGVDDLKRRDRTPQDPGYYVECKNNRLSRRDFKSNEECQAFIANLSADKEELSEVDPDAEAKAEQAAADLLAELGLADLEDLEDPSSSASKTEKPPSSGKKKKRGGKKKGRK